jgi:thiol-disulfide isomerase/thioredoxin
MTAQIGQPAPLLSVSGWVQGGPVNFDQLTGRVVLVEVFQVNCPGCFLYALPQAIYLHQRYADQGLSVLGVATAFEDFDTNNLVRLAEKGQVVGETLLALSQRGELIDGRLPYRIPFPLAMDRLYKREDNMSDEDILSFIRARVSDFDRQSEAHQQQIEKQVKRYFQSLTYQAESFERFDLKGTPSHILVDKHGVLRDCAFGACPELEARIQDLLQE